MNSTDAFDLNFSLNNNNKLVHYTKNRPRPASYYKNQYMKKKKIQENVNSIAEEIENEIDFDRKSIDIKSIDFNSGLDENVEDNMVAMTFKNNIFNRNTEQVNYVSIKSFE